jgi:hypothetical protein
MHLTIEIINKTRGGITILTSENKKECGNWGTISSPGCVLVLVRSFNLANESMILYPGPKFAPPLAAFPNFILDASSSVIYNLYGQLTISSDDVDSECFKYHLIKAESARIIVVRKRTFT